MANKRITDLDAITELTSDDLFVVINDPDGTPVSKKVDYDTVLPEGTISTQGKTNFRCWRYGTPEKGAFKQAKIGDDSNYLNIDTEGVVTLAGTAKRTLTLRPEIDFTAQLAHSKPTQVTIGIFKGFSFPIYNNDNEELFFRQRVPQRWDGVSDIMFYAGVCLSAAEDVGDYFKFRFAWEHTSVGKEVPTTSNNVDVEQAVLVGRNAQYDLYRLDFTIDYDIDGVGNEIASGDLLVGRLYRIDATNPDVSNEIILLNWATEYTVDRMFGA